MPSRFARLSAGLFAASLLVAACGDDDTDSADDATTEVTEAEESTTTAADDMAEEEEMAEEEVASDDIVDTAVSAGDFTTLVAAVQAAGLEETLRGEGPFTVFAPTDDAFAALPAGTVDTLLADPSGDLTDILTYHVIEGAVLAEEVVGMDGQEVTTVNGATFTINVDGDAVSLTDAAGNTVNVVMTDIVATNGIIHVIDAVMMPS